MANTPSRPIDPELVALDGGIFNGVPRTVIPLEVFGLEKYIELSPRDRARHDSLMPVSGAHREPHHVPAHRDHAFFALGAAVALGVAGIVVAGTFNPRVPRGAPASAAAAIEAPEATLAVAPLPPPAPEAVVADPPVAPVLAPSAAAEPARAAPRALAAPRVAAGPPRLATAPLPAAAAPLSTADLPAWAAEIPPAAKPPEIAFDRTAAAVVLAGAGMRAGHAGRCREEGGPLAVPVRVTFAGSGRATAAVVGGDLAGTPAGSCLAAALRLAAVPAFDGEPVIVSTTLHLR